MHVIFLQISSVTPGTAAFGTGRSPNSYFAGVRSSLDDFMTQSKLTARPVYALIRPMTAVSVLSAIRRPSFSGFPARMLATRSVCS